MIDWKGGKQIWTSYNVFNEYKAVAFIGQSIQKWTK